MIVPFACMFYLISAQLHSGAPILWYAIVSVLALELICRRQGGSVSDNFIWGMRP